MKSSYPRAKDHQFFKEDSQFTIEHQNCIGKTTPETLWVVLGVESRFEYYVGNSKDAMIVLLHLTSQKQSGKQEPFGMTEAEAFQIDTMFWTVFEPESKTYFVEGNFTGFAYYYDCPSVVDCDYVAQSLFERKRHDAAQGSLSASNTQL